MGNGYFRNVFPLLRVKFVFTVLNSHQQTTSSSQKHILGKPHQGASVHTGLNKIEKGLSLSLIVCSDTMWNLSTRHFHIYYSYFYCKCCTHNKKQNQSYPVSDNYILTIKLQAWHAKVWKKEQSTVKAFLQVHSLMLRPSPACACALSPAYAF